ncbi:hypothetical protein OE88DRAFT_412241 [Heliocybe sulcata]|uniref:F-box domain-containing protein n=1 Tax=Heliocybe sulcata TaxID=5364 RepID=A0A5C3MV36_9AGAM|nr:hypothetical protein OE88DRAFT_412241 [Heliocybe sulcata]
MQAALLNRDIILEILNHTEIRTTWKDVAPLRRHRRDLLCIALSCKAFLDPALDLLWKRMDSLVPLFRILSGFVWQYSGHVLLGSVPSKELTRLIRYAACIREIKISSSHRRIHSSALHRLWQLLQAPILPRLRTLFWDGADLSTLQSIFFITASLVHVDIQISSKPEAVRENHELAAFLDTLADQASSLQHLTVHGWLPQYCIRAFARMKGLQSLHLKGCQLLAHRLAPALPPVLHPFQRLSSLSIDCCIMLDMLAGIHSSLENLEHLELFGDLTLCLHALDSLASRRLVSLSVRFSLGKAGDYPHFFRKVASRFPRLRCFRAHLPSTSWWPPIRQYDFKDVFEPLLDLRHMEDCVLELMDVMILVEDQEVEQLAASWPRLRSFSASHRLHDDGRGPTMLCLHAFAEYCQSLEELDFPVRLSIQQGLPYPTPSSHGLKHLHLADPLGEYAETDRIAQFLIALYPSLNLRAMARRDVCSRTWRDIIEAMMRLRGPVPESDS